MTRRRDTTVAFAATLMLLAVLWAGLLEVTRRQTEAGLADAHSRAESLARLVEANLERSLDAANAMQELATMETAGGPRTPEQRAASPVYAELRRLTDREHFGMLQVAAIAPNGWTLWSTVAPDAAPVDLSDRVHIRVPLQGAPGVFVGEVVLGRVSNRVSLQLSRRMLGPDGQLLGIAVVSFNPLSLSTFFDGLGLGSRDEAMVLRAGGMVTASSRGLDRVGRRLADDDPLRQAVRSGRTELVQGEARQIIATRSLPQVPLQAVVVLDEEDALRDVHAYRRALLVSGELLTLMILSALAAFIAWRRRASRLAVAAVELAAARASEARFRTMAESLGDLVLVHEPDGTVTYASPAAERLLGILPSALLGQHLAGLAHPLDRPEVVRAFAAAVDSGSGRIPEYRVRTAAGDWVWLETAVEQLGTARAEAPRLISSSRDVTARREAEQRLQAALSQLNHLLEVAPVALYAVAAQPDGSWQQVLMSPSVERLSGWTQEQAMAPGWWPSNLHPEDALAAQQAMPRVLASGQAVHEYRFRTPDGEWRWIRDALRRVEDSALEVVGCWVDVTEEHALRQQLIQASKLATLGEMATGMAHELNQPLATIMAAAEALLERAAEGPVAPASLEPRLQRIRRQAERASSLIDHMRIFGRVGDGSAKPVELHAVVQGALTIIGPRLASLGVQLREEWQDGLPTVMGEVVLLEQVVLNLLSNACDEFEGRVVPRLSRHITIRGGHGPDGVTLAVEDSAGGIPDAAIAKVFQPFFTTKPVGKGTGLGLAISFGILRDLGGALDVHNTAAGACFTLRLPAAVVQQAA